MTDLNFILSRNLWIYIEICGFTLKLRICVKSTDFIEIHTSVLSLQQEKIITKET